MYLAIPLCAITHRLRNQRLGGTVKNEKSRSGYLVSELEPGTFQI
jgi:hypothetical protein